MTKVMCYRHSVPVVGNLKGKAEEILAEEQAGFRAGRSTLEQIFNVRLITEKTASPKRPDPQFHRL